MSTVVDTVEIDKPVVHYRCVIKTTREGGVAWNIGLEVRDGGYRIWLYRATEKGPKLVTHIPCAPNRKADMTSALEKVTRWAHEQYED